MQRREFLTGLAGSAALNAAPHRSQRQVAHILPTASDRRVKQDRSPFPDRMAAR